jgi:hypothetical protein
MESVILWISDEKHLPRVCSADNIKTYSDISQIKSSLISDNSSFLHNVILFQVTDISSVNIEMYL